MSRHRPAAVLLALCAVGGLGLPAASGQDTAPGPDQRLTTDEQQVDEAPLPELRWEPCPDEGNGVPVGFECAVAWVPRDYDRPDGKKIRLALAKRPADNPADRIGTIFINPGGPGGSGVDFAIGAADFLFTPQVRARFDIVGFDPRGVARSTPLLCFKSFGALNNTLAPFLFPYTAAEEAEWITADRKAARACERNGRRIIRHMATANVARDMDLLRRAVGDEQMTFVGYSYGSLIGATYANMFPNRVRAVVIDGVIDPVSFATGRGDEAETLPVDARLESEQGAYQSLQAFLTLCDQGGPNCAFSSGNPVRKFDRLAARLLDEPLILQDESGNPFPYGYQELVWDTLGAMYSTGGWYDFAAFLQFLYDQSAPDASAARLRLLEQRVVPRAYSQTFEGFWAPWCDADNPADPQAWAITAAAADARYPYFGRPWIWGSSICAWWPVEARDSYAGPFDRDTANPVLVVGTVNDPATRYEDAVSTAAMMPRGHLLTVDATRHTSLGISTCADRIIGRYLLTSAVPDQERTCPADVVPFSTPAPPVRSVAGDWVAAVNQPGRR